MRAGLKLILNRAWQKNGFDVFVVAENRDGLPTHAAQPLTLAPLEEDRPSYASPEPTFFLHLRDCQALVNELHRAGFRPDESLQAGDAIGASKEHIADLRKVAFALLDTVTKSH